MFKKFYKLLSLVVLMCIISSAFCMPVEAADVFSNNKGKATLKCGNYIKEFYPSEYENRLSKALRFALVEAGEIATASKPATVTLEKGNYQFDNLIYIYSNTTLNVTGSHIRYGTCVLSNQYDGDASSATGYNGANNIKIIGGIWDICGDYSKANNIRDTMSEPIMKFAHCSNIEIKNATFKNNYSGHDITLGGTKNVKITNCVFKNDKNVNGFKIVNGKEAIQIDLNTKASYDNTPTVNLDVSNCVFENKFRGVGSHHGVIGKPYKNIKIYNNTFKNINGIAVYLVHCLNAQVYNNKFVDVGSGIYISGVMYADTILNKYNYSKTKTENTLKKLKSYIYGNTITVRKKKNTIPYTYGVRADGGYYKKNDSKTKIKKGLYYCYGVNVGITPNGKYSGNTIKGNVNCAISMRYTKNAKVYYNKIKSINCTQDICYGIEVRCSKTTKIVGNNISNKTRKNFIGVMVADLDSNGKKVSDLTISKNKITNYYKSSKKSKGNYGVRLYNDSTSIKISSNTIISGNEGICATGYTDKTKSAKKYTITSNKFKTYATKNHIIFRSVKLSKKISGNKTTTGKKAKISIA